MIHAEQQRRRGHQRPGQAGRAQQPPGGPLQRARTAAPHLRGHPDPHPAQVDVGRHRGPGAGARASGLRPCRSSRPSLRRGAAAQRRPQQPPDPVRAALHRARRDPQQRRHLRHRAVLHVQEPPHLAFRAARRPERGDRGRQVGPGQRRLRRVGRLPAGPPWPPRGSSGRGRAAAAQQQRGLPAGDAPQPAAGRAARAGSRPRRAIPRGTSPAARPRPRRRAAPRAAGPPATARAGRTAPAARCHRRPLPGATSPSSSIAPLLQSSGGWFAPAVTYLCDGPGPAVQAAEGDAVAAPGGPATSIGP